jgi:hypothetical protein
MTHIAMWEGATDGSPETTWVVPVADDEYLRRPEADLHIDALG